MRSQSIWFGSTSGCNEIETLIAAAQEDRWAALIASCGLDETQVGQVLDSEAFGPLCAELRRAEANNINPETTLPRLVAARSLVGAVDVASVLHGRLAPYVDNTTASRRVRSVPRYILGLIPQASDRLDPAMASAIHDASTPSGQGERPAHPSGRCPGTMGGCARYKALRSTIRLPLGRHRARSRRLPGCVGVTTDDPLGDPSTLVQRQDAARLFSMLTHRVATPETSIPPPRSSTNSL